MSAKERFLHYLIAKESLEARIALIILDAVYTGQTAQLKKYTVQTLPKTGVRV